MHCTASDATVRRIYQVVMCHHIVQGSTYKGQYTFAMLGPSSARRVVAFTKRNLNTNHARNWPYPGVWKAAPLQNTVLATWRTVTASTLLPRPNKQSGTFVNPNTTLYEVAGDKNGAHLVLSQLLQ